MSAVSDQLPVPSRSHYEKIKITDMGVCGQKYELGNDVNISMKLGYYMENDIKEKIIFNGKEYIKISCEQEDGIIYQDIKEVDASGTEYQLNRKNGVLKGRIECSSDIPFSDMGETGRIDIEVGIAYQEAEDGSCEMQFFDENYCSENWKDLLFSVERDDWDKYKTSFYYIKTSDGVLVYKNPTPLISLRLYCVEKMRDFTLYEERE